jgi:hypothetical protein
MKHRQVTQQPRRRRVAPVWALASAFLALPALAPRADALVVTTGGGSPTSANSTNNIAPTSGTLSHGDPGFNNVGTFTEGSSSLAQCLGSGVYLGNGVVLTVGHLWDAGTGDPNLNTFNVDGGSYAMVAGSEPYLIDDSGGRYTGLAIVTLATSPNVPALTLPTTVAKQGTVAMIAFGNAATGAYQSGISGFAVGSPISTGELWGANPVTSGSSSDADYSNYVAGNDGTLAWMFSTAFTSSRTNSAQVEFGDSGGAVFYYSGGQWLLQGIIYGQSTPKDGGYAVDGDTSYMIDLGDYHTVIENAIAATPEPASLLLLVAGGCALLGRRRR